MKLVINTPKDIKSMYDLSDEEMVAFNKELFSEILEKIENIYINHMYQMDDVKTRMKILEEINRCMIKGVGDCRLMYVKNKSTHFNIGDIVKDSVIRTGNVNYTFSSYLVQLALIKIDKAFIKIK